MARELNSRIEEFESDAKLDVGVLYGVGGSFSSGYDLNEIQMDGFEGHLHNQVSIFNYKSDFPECSKISPF